MENTMTQKPREQTSAYLSVEDVDRLHSWKEIARYLNRDVRTIQRWETFESLPIHRHFHRKSGTVYGFKTEIDAWRKNRSYRESVDREQKLRPTVHFEHYSIPIETQTLRELLAAALTEFIAQSSIFVATLAPGAQAKERIAFSSQGTGETRRDTVATISSHIHFCPICNDLWTCVCWLCSEADGDLTCKTCREKQDQAAEAARPSKRQCERRS